MNREESRYRRHRRGGDAHDQPGAGLYVAYLVQAVSGPESGLGGGDRYLPVTLRFAHRRGGVPMPHAAHHVLGTYR